MVNKKIVTFFLALIVFPSMYSMDYIIKIGSNLTPIGSRLLQGILNNPQIAASGLGGLGLASFYYKKVAIEPNEKSIEEHKEALEGLKIESNKMLEQLDALNPMVGENNKDLEKQSTKIKDITESLESLIKILDDLNTNKENLEQKLATINTAESENLKKAKTIQDQIALNNTTIAHLNAQVTQLSEQLKNNNDNLKNQLLELEKKSVKNVEQIKIIKDQSEALEKKTLKLKETTKEATEKIRSLLIEEFINKGDIYNHINQKLLAREQERIERDKDIKETIMKAKEKFDTKFNQLNEDCKQKLSNYENKICTLKKTINVKFNPEYIEPESIELD